MRCSSRARSVVNKADGNPKFIRNDASSPTASTGPPLGQGKSQREATPSCQTHRTQYLRARVGVCICMNFQKISKIGNQTIPNSPNTEPSFGRTLFANYVAMAILVVVSPAPLLQWAEVAVTSTTNYLHFVMPLPISRHRSVVLGGLVTPHIISTSDFSDLTSSLVSTAYAYACLA